MTTQARLSAVDVIHPGVGQALIIDEGQVLVFAQEAGGRRIPLATVEAGSVIVGCDPHPQARMLVVGVGQSLIRRTTLDDMAEADLMTWVHRLGDVVADGRWPARLISVDSARALVSPGEHIGGASGRQAVWLRVTGGSGTWCGSPGAQFEPGGPPIVLTSSTWLTAGLRCRVVEASAPVDARAWASSLNQMGQAALGTVVARRRDHDAAAVERIAERSRDSAAAAEEAVGILTAAVGGVPRLPRLSDQKRTEELAAALLVARESGFSLDEQNLQRVGEDVESGREAIAAVAAISGARPNSVTLRSDWWQREGSPMLVRIGERARARTRPAAVVWRAGHWDLVNPATGDVQEVDAELAERVDANAYEMLRVLPGQPLTLRALGRLAFHGSRGELLVIGSLTALLAAIAFITPFLLGQLSNILLSERPNTAFAALFGALLLVVVAGTMFQAVRALALLRARSRAAAVSATALWERVMRQRATWHADRSLGDRLNQASAVNNASAAMPDQVVAQVLDVSFVIGSLAAIATTNSTMLLALTGLLVIQVAVTVMILRAAIHRAEQRFGASAAATTMLMETFGAVNRLRVAGAESRAYMRWARVQAPFIRADQALRRLAMLQGVLVSVWPMLTLVVVVGVTAATDASFGAFVTAQTAAGAATAAISAMTGAASAVLVARQSLRQAEPVLASVPEGGLEGVAPGAISGSLEARELVFRYGPDLPAVLDHVSISVHPGEHVAVVGPSGCGKTTLMRVLLGLEEPDSGVIAVDGRDMAWLNRPAVRRQIGSVLQSSSLLPCSIKDNVDMGRGLRADEIWEALTQANLAEDVRGMAMGLETMVTDGGGTISGGQRQRVLIARALAGKPRMLVLDEATSALDNVTQAAVVESLSQLRITRIVVAHRLSTIRDADRVIVMEAGRVVDEGTFDELISRPGTFRELVERQNL